MTRKEMKQLRLFEKSLKTLAILSVTFALFYGLSDSELFGFISLLIITAYLHDVGKSRRPGNNIRTSIASFFSSSQTANMLEANNAFRNTINGGGWLFDFLKEIITSAMEDDNSIHHRSAHR